MTAQSNCYEELAKALIEVARLRSKLKKYGQHPDQCNGWEPTGKCDCGLLDALQGGSDGK